jgi:hypothetical protein
VAVPRRRLQHKLHQELLALSPQSPVKLSVFVPRVMVSAPLVTKVLGPAQLDNVQLPKLRGVRHLTTRTLRVVVVEIASQCVKATTPHSMCATLVPRAPQILTRGHPLSVRAVRMEPTHQLVHMATHARWCNFGL